MREWMAAKESPIERNGRGIHPTRISQHLSLSDLAMHASMESVDVCGMA
jgi:hypothetical protein